MLLYEIDGDSVLSASWHNNIRVLLRWKAKLLECWLHQGCVLEEKCHQSEDKIKTWYLVQNMFEITSPLLNVPQNSSCQPGVCICVHKELHVEQIAQGGVVEDQDALDQDHVGGVDGGELARKPSVGIEV